MSAFSFTVARSVLREAMTKLLGVVPNKASIPVLTCFRLDVASSVDEIAADDGKARVVRAGFYATDLDTSLTLKVPVSAVGCGSAAIPAKRLAEILATLSSAHPVTLAVNGMDVTVTSGRSKFQFTALALAEFPILPEQPVTSEFTLRADTFLSGIARVLPLASEEDQARPALCTALLDIVDGRLLVVASDGNCLGRLDIGAAPRGAKQSQYLLHNYSARSLAKLLGGLSGDAELSVKASEGRLVVTAGDIVVGVALSPSVFPNYAPLIPVASAATRVFRAARVDLADAIRRVAVSADGNMRRVVWSLSCDQTAELRLSAESQLGVSEDVVSIENYRDETGAPFRIGMSARYALAALEAIATDDVEVSLIAPERQITFRPVELPAGDLTVALIMPIRLAA